MFGENDFLAPEGARNLSPVVLAFVGDAVYSLYVREKLVRETDYKTAAAGTRTSQPVQKTPAWANITAQQASKRFWAFCI